MYHNQGYRGTKNKIVLLTAFLLNYIAIQSSHMSSFEIRITLCLIVPFNISLSDSEKNMQYILLRFNNPIHCFKNPLYSYFLITHV